MILRRQDSYQKDEAHLPQEDGGLLSLKALEVGGCECEESLPPAGEELVPPDPEVGLSEGEGITPVQVITRDRQPEL